MLTRTMNDEGNTALIPAAETGHMEIAQLLLEAGANKDWQDCEGSTALILAAQNGPCGAFGSWC